MLRSFNVDNQDHDFLSFFEDDERVNKNDPRRKKYVNINEIPSEESDDDKLYDLLYDLFYDLGDDEDEYGEGGDMKDFNVNGFNDGFDEDGEIDDCRYPKFEPFSRFQKKLKFRC